MRLAYLAAPLLALGLVGCVAQGGVGAHGSIGPGGGPGHYGPPPAYGAGPTMPPYGAPVRPHNGGRRNGPPIAGYVLPHGMVPGEWRATGNTKVVPHGARVDTRPHPCVRFEVQGECGLKLRE